MHVKRRLIQLNSADTFCIVCNTRQDKTHDSNDGDDDDDDDIYRTPHSQSPRITENLVAQEK